MNFREHKRMINSIKNIYAFEKYGTWCTHSFTDIGHVQKCVLQITAQNFRY